MDKLKEDILRLIREKCRDDLRHDPTQPVGYDIPSLLNELDKLNGVGSTAVRDIEQALDELSQSGEVRKTLRSYIVLEYDKR